MLLYAWKLFDAKKNWHSEIDDAPDLDALLATVLINHFQRRLRIGLGRAYENQDRVIAGIKGRVDFSRSLKRMALPLGKAHCKFHSYDVDVPKNRIIRSILAWLLMVGNFGNNKTINSEITSRLRKTVRDVDTVRIVPLSGELIRNELRNRHDNDYRLMLSICEYLWDQNTPTEQSGKKNTPFLDRNELRMHRIFEKFVAEYYRIALVEWRVSSQKNHAWPADQPCSYLPALKPDLILRHRKTSVVVIVDTKFTANSLKPSPWDPAQDKFVTDHLYQIYAYVRATEELSEHHRTSSGILLYPTINQNLSESVTVQGHRLFWRSVDLSQHWQAIESDLIRIVADILPNHSVAI